jgi:alkylated DNA repair dioxygenase AlkB
VTTTLRDTKLITIDETFLADSVMLFDRLVTSIAWDERMSSRKAASFGVPYNYSGIFWPKAPFPECLLSILERVAQRLGHRPNNCLAHFYPDGTSTMGFHSDATKELEPDTGIAVVSLGAERAISFRHQRDKSQLEHYQLPSGSLLFMTAAMQADWKHAILATDTAQGGRISLTFRQMKSSGIVSPGAQTKPR